MCTPTSPRCLVCPLATRASRARDRPPGRAAGGRAAQEAARAAAARARRAVDRATRGEIVLARRAPDGLFGGLWELPPLDVADARSALQRRREPVAYHDQTLTHRRLRIAVVARRDARAPCRPRDPGYDAIARVALATRARARHRRRDHRDPDEVRGHSMELDPKALALFTEGYDKILEGLAQLGYDINDDELHGHRDARGERLPRARPRPEAGEGRGRRRCSRRRSRRSTPRW